MLPVVSFGLRKKILFQINDWIIQSIILKRKVESEWGWILNLTFNFYTHISVSSQYTYIIWRNICTTHISRRERGTEKQRDRGRHRDRETFKKTKRHQMSMVTFYIVNITLVINEVIARFSINQIGQENFMILHWLNFVFLEPSGNVSDFKYSTFLKIYGFVRAS